MWCCICMRKTNAKYVFSKNPCVFRILNNCFKKNLNKNAIITRSLHHETLFFTIHLLRAQEAWKHCCQWMKIHIFARLHWEEWSQKRARTRGRSVVVVVVVVDVDVGVVVVAVAVAVYVAVAVVVVVVDVGVVVVAVAVAVYVAVAVVVVVVVVAIGVLAAVAATWWYVRPMPFEAMQFR